MNTRTVLLGIALLILGASVPRPSQCAGGSAVPNVPKKPPSTSPGTPQKTHKMA